MDAGLARYFGGDRGGRRGGDPPRDRYGPHQPPPQLSVNSWPLLARQRYDEALVELRRAREIEPGLPEAIACASGYASALAGRAADAEAARRELDALAKTRYVGGFPFAVLTLGQKKWSESLGWLEKSCADGDGRLAYLGVERGFDPLRNDPRFADVVRRLGIPRPR